MKAAQTAFVESVLKLRPRVAVFDCDGTLWDGDAGAEFLYWELDRKLIPSEAEQFIRPRYEEYKAGRVDEAVICGEMVTIHAGVSCELLDRAAAEFFKEKFARRIFPELLELTFRLRNAGCELWAVSSTNDWVIRAAMRHFAIPIEHVLAACVFVENGRASDRLRAVPTGPDKPKAIVESVHGQVDVAFGNSIHDAEMLALARHAWAVNPNEDLARLAAELGWTVYEPNRF